MPTAHKGPSDVGDVGHTEALLKTGALQSAIFNSANFSSIATDANAKEITSDDRARLNGYVSTIEQPDLILMDMQLPGMDGLTATMLLKQDEATRAIPVIALTALAMKGDEARIRAAGCSAYIAKPLAYQDFFDVISAQLLAPRS